MFTNKRLTKKYEKCGSGMFLAPRPDGSRVHRCSNPRCDNNRVHLTVIERK
nr:hypothetical protein [[Eubacterium] tenue]